MSHQTPVFRVKRKLYVWACLDVSDYLSFRELLFELPVSQTLSVRTYYDAEGGTVLLDLGMVGSEAEYHAVLSWAIDAGFGYVQPAYWSLTKRLAFEEEIRRFRAKADNPLHRPLLQLVGQLMAHKSTGIVALQSMGSRHRRLARGSSGVGSPAAESYGLVLGQVPWVPAPEEKTDGDEIRQAGARPLVTPPPSED